METADDIIALPERLVPPMDRRERAFRIALAVAFVLHAALFIDVGRRAPQRSLGDRSGADDAIAVEIVTSADLKSRESVAMPPAGAPAPPVTPQPPEPEPKQEPPQPEPQPQAEPQPEPEPQPKAAEPAPVAPAEEKPKEQPPEQKEPAKEKEQAALPDFESLLPNLATMPQPTENAEKPPEQTKAEDKAAEAPKPAERKELAKKKQPQKQARAEPTPQDLSSAPPGRSAGAMRPPGITRSGENDDFGRGVIRALRATMPPPRGIYGRVTIRIILNQNGDVAELQLLDTSGTSLDQSVMFAAKQSYFPLPPYNATLADRTFTITYVYR